MKAMILAAGLGRRMGKLTEKIPKPLLKVGKYSLIEHHLITLAQAGIIDIVINLSYQREALQDTLGDGNRYGVKLHYCLEEEILGTGGGIFNALPTLGDDPFLVISADIFTDYPFASIPNKIEGLAHFIMVDNPSYHPTGDYCLQQGKVCRGDQGRLNYGGIAVLSPVLFTDCTAGHFSLCEVFNPAIDAGTITGEYYQGSWFNVGTPEELKRATIASQKSEHTDDQLQQTTDKHDKNGQTQANTILS